MGGRKGINIFINLYYHISNLEEILLILLMKDKKVSSMGYRMNRNIHVR